MTISRNTTGRSVLLPMGNTSFPKVRTANLLASRHCFERNHKWSRWVGLLSDGVFCVVGFGFWVYRKSVVTGIHTSNITAAQDFR